jgi:hypothetical protein
MGTSKRDSVRVHFGDKDPIDRLLSETLNAVAEASGVDRSPAGKRLMTLGVFAYHGYDWRVLTDRMPKQKIVWVDIVWALLRDEGRRIVGNATTAAMSVRDTDEERLQASTKCTTPKASTMAEYQSSTAQDLETPTQPTPRINAIKLKYP